MLEFIASLYSYPHHLMTILTIILVLAALIIGLAAIILIVGRKPLKHKIRSKDLERQLSVLLWRGYDRGLMFIEPPVNRRDKRFLQFAKYLEEDNVAGIQFAVPRAAWSARYFEALKQVLDENEIENLLTLVEDGDTSAFLLVDVKKDVRKGAEVARLSLE